MTFNRPLIGATYEVSLLHIYLTYVKFPPLAGIETGTSQSEASTIAARPGACEIKLITAVMNGHMTVKNVSVL